MKLDFLLKLFHFDHLMIYLIVVLLQVSGIVEKKICAVGLTKWLCETNCFITGAYSQYWPKILATLVGFFELPQDDSIPGEQI